VVEERVGKKFGDASDPLLLPGLLMELRLVLLHRDPA